MNVGPGKAISGGPEIDAEHESCDPRTGHAAAGATENTASAPSPLLAVFDRWFQYVVSSENLVHLTHEAFRKTLTEPELFRILELDSSKIKRAEWKAEQARREIDAGFPNLHAHALLGLFGALECLVEDLFVASVRHDTSLLGADRFARVKIPLTAIFGTDEDQKYQLIMSEASRTINSDLAIGVSKYEGMLGLVGLGGPIPRLVRDYVHEGQQVRNVWAHRGGIADARLVQHCPNAGFVVGAPVNISAHKFMMYMHSLHMYGVVITNRHLANLGRAPVIAECQGFEGSLAEIA